MSTVNTLRQRRSTIVDNMRTLTTLASTETRDLTEDEDTRFQELRAKLATLDKDIERTEILDAAERSAPSIVRGVGDGTQADFYRSASLFKAINGQIDKSVDDGREREISQDIVNTRGRSPRGIYFPHEALLPRETRATVTTTGTGSGLIQTDHRADLFIDPLRESVAVAQLGATVLSLKYATEIPRLDSSATGYWVAEDAAITQSDVDINALSLDGTTVGAELAVSRKTIQQSEPAVEDVLKGDLTAILGDEINSKAIAGTGTGATPTGILSTSGITDIAHGANGGPPTWASVLSFISSIGNDKALRGKLGWLTNPSVVSFLRQTVRVASTDSRMIMDGSTELADYPLVQSTHAPADLTKATGTDLSALIFGNWADLFIAYFSAVDILVNPYHTDVYSKGGLLINALQDVDIKLRHAASFAAAVDLDLS